MAFPPRAIHSLVFCAICLAFVVGLQFGRVSAETPEGRELTSLRAQLATARRDLNAEREERSRLDAELSGLRDWLDLLSEELRAVEPEEEEELQEGGELRTVGQESEGDAVEGAEDDPAPRTSRSAFDQQVLIEAGLSSQEAERLRDLWGEIEMEKAALTARAAREGWSRSYAHFNAVRQLDERARENLDEDTYDLYLYASRRPNRLVVRDVIDGSPASRAGIQPGDKILRYEGRRVFASTDLEELAASAERGEYVRLEILRSGRELSFVAPEASLGVLAAVTLDPPRVN